MITQINKTAIQDMILKSDLKKEKPLQKLETPGPDASLQTEYGNLISKAMEADGAGQMVIQQAKELIADGSIDSIEAMRRAAQSLIDQGI